MDGWQQKGCYSVNLRGMIIAVSLRQDIPRHGGFHTWWAKSPMNC